MNRPDTDAQDQLLQIITFGLQRAAGHGPGTTECAAKKAAAILEALVRRAAR